MSTKRDDPRASAKTPTVIDSVLRLIKGHVCQDNQDSEKTLIVHVPEYVGNCPAIREALCGIVYEYEDQVLLVKAIPSDLHSTCTTWFTNMFINQILQMLTLVELDHGFLNLDVREVQLPGLQSSNNFTGTPKQGRKIADNAVVF